MVHDKEDPIIAAKVMSKKTGVIGANWKKEKSDNKEDQKNEPAARSLRKLAGGWSDKEASEFLKSINSCGKIDKDP